MATVASFQSASLPFLARAASAATKLRVGTACAARHTDQWPTILSLLMFPALSVMYVDAAHTEEDEALDRVGAFYSQYTAGVPHFPIPADSPDVT